METREIMEAFKAQEPKLDYDREMHDYFSTLRKDRRTYKVCDIKPLGEGASGLTFTGFIKRPTVGTFSEQIVIKEQERNRFCINEAEALKFLKQMLLTKTFPAYFIFLYGTFTSGGNLYNIVEKADIILDDYLANYDYDTKTFFTIFYHIANAVSYLESKEFNHGDLWQSNIMLKWLPNQEGIPENEKKFVLKIIDFDASFKSDSLIQNPAWGGAKKFRTKFILGYDLNRFFDGLIYTYNSYVKKKTLFKKKKIERLRKQKKAGKQVTIPSMTDVDKDDLKFDKENIIYPEEVLEFMFSLHPKEPDYFLDCPEMSGQAIMEKIIEQTLLLGIDLV